RALQAHLKNLRLCRRIFIISILIDLSLLLNINLIICVYRNEDNLNCFRLRCTLYTQALKL
ncbi:hypothetical protein EXQ04_00005, partial [Salmonella enterica subsp. enterica serovar Havana]|nr:hypothetical protein [Salmonella enterica subsp. enterica serovar Havana]